MSDDPLPPLREVIARHGLRADRRLGQNFILDLNLTRRIARAAAPLDKASILEIGPGPGGLTRALLAEGAHHVVAVERDPRALPALEEIAAAWPGRLTIVHGDALAIDLCALLPAGPVKIVANLPYNIGTALFVRWMQGAWPPFWQSMTLMFQREVAGRIVAAPGSRAYGRLAILAQWRARPRIVMTLPPAAFTPAPRVDSAVVQITPAPPLDPGLDPALLESVVEAAFSQRRKMLRASLKTLLKEPSALLTEAAIDPAARAEAVDVAGFCRLARLLQDRAGASAR
ncbi:MAG: 16S rRNA (adenine(1518)-N(6)/adenine(1519)-N(6))-dimethyltransferase RsmA [Rhodothalassiaceae bacterium]